MHVPNAVLGCSCVLRLIQCNHRATPERLSPLSPRFHHTAWHLQCHTAARVTRPGGGWVHTHQTSSPAPDAGMHAHVHAADPARGAVTSGKGTGGKQKWKMPKIGTAGSARACWSSHIGRKAFPQSWTSSTVLIATLCFSSTEQTPKERR